MFTFEHHFFSFIFIFGTFVAIAVARATNICEFQILFQTRLKKLFSPRLPLCKKFQNL